MLTSFTDALFNALVKTDASGQRIYFPGGVTGRGYIIPDAGTEARLRQTHRKVMLWTFGLIVLFAGPAPGIINSGAVPFWQLSAGFIAFLIPFGYITRRTLSASVEGLRTAEAKLSLTEAFSAQGRSFPRWFWIAEIAFSAFMIFGGIILLSTAETGLDVIKGSAALLFFVALLAWAVHGLKSRNAVLS